jgi:hypothetical protein
VDEGKTIELLSEKTTSQVAGDGSDGIAHLSSAARSLRRMDSVKLYLSQSPPAGTGYGGQVAEVAEKDSKYLPSES